MFLKWKVVVTCPKGFRVLFYFHVFRFVLKFQSVTKSIFPLKSAKELIWSFCDLNSVTKLKRRRLMYFSEMLQKYGACLLKSWKEMFLGIYNIGEMQAHKLVSLKSALCRYLLKFFKFVVDALYLRSKMFVSVQCIVERKRCFERRSWIKSTKFCLCFGGDHVAFFTDMKCVETNVIDIIHRQAVATKAANIFP